MNLGTAFARHCAQQSAACESMQAPFTARICRLLGKRLHHAEAPALLERLLNWPGDMADAALALRLCGGLHRLALDGSAPGLTELYREQPADEAACWSVLAPAIASHQGLLASYLDTPPQTNETGRAAFLLPALLLLARRFGCPFELAEMGSSGGLNLQLDRFCYDYGSSAVWPRSGHTGPGPLLRVAMHGAVPDLCGELQICRRSGCDKNPIDLVNPEARQRLFSYIWPEQDERRARMAAAVRLAQAHPVPVVQASGIEFLRRRLAERLPETGFVFFHTIVWQYLDAGEQEAITAALAQAGAKATPAAPLAWLRLESDEGHRRARLDMDLWPGGEHLPLAVGDYHGRWMDWY